MYVASDCCCVNAFEWIKGALHLYTNLWPIAVLPLKTRRRRRVCPTWRRMGRFHWKYRIYEWMNERVVLERQRHLDDLFYNPRNLLVILWVLFVKRFTRLNKLVRNLERKRWIILSKIWFYLLVSYMVRFMELEEFDIKEKCNWIVLISSIPFPF